MKSISFAAAVSGPLLAAATIQGALAWSTGDEPVTRHERRERARRPAPSGGDAEPPQRRGVRGVRAEAEELKAEKERLEREPNRTDRFERRVRAYNAKAEAARVKDASFRASLDALNQAVVAHNTRCGGISFLPEDKEAILKEREAAK